MRKTTAQIILLAVLAVGLGAPSLRSSHAQTTPALKVASFPGMPSLPILAAAHIGAFEKRGVHVQPELTTNSTNQREKLTKGEYQIIHTSADNAVAMVENAKIDVVVVMGGDDAFNHIIGQKDIASLADLRGRTVAVDAPNTAFALLLYRALGKAGLKEGDYKVNAVGGTPQRLKAMLDDKANAAAVLGPPFSLQGEAAGLKDLGAVPTSHTGAVTVMRGWAANNGDAVVRYLRAVVDGRRWLLDQSRKGEVVAFMASAMKVTPDIAEKAYELMTGKNGSKGFEVDGRFDAEGFRSLLQLRADVFNQWKGKPPEPSKYVDLSFYDKAMGSL